jgi:hypothetical protein
VPLSFRPLDRGNRFHRSLEQSLAMKKASEPAELLMQNTVGLRMHIRVLGMLALISACHPAERRPSPHHAGAVPPVTSTSAAVMAQGTPRARPHDAPLPGCNDASADALRNQIYDLTTRAKTLGENSVAAFRADLLHAWHAPCLAHTARLFDAPAEASAGTFQAAFEDGLGEALALSVGGLHIANGKRQFIVLPEVGPALEPEASQTLTAFLCRNNDPECARTRSYVHRAEVAFEQTVQRDTSKSETTAPAPDPCTNAVERWKGAASPTAFEAWALCVTGEAPELPRYANVRLRAPERGWMVLRGRRGHYAFADEIRAYDLATGAAYVARSESALVLGGQRRGGVDVDATDKARRGEAYAGRVSSEQLREFAFVLLTRTAVGYARRQPTFVDVPDNLAFQIGPDDGSSFGSASSMGNMWGSSAQTTIAYTFFGDEVNQRPTGTTQRGSSAPVRGSFQWPTASDVSEDHADELLRVLEAGIVRGCAPARLPHHAATAAGSGGVSALDASSGALAGTQSALERALAGLSTQACPNAR